MKAIRKSNGGSKLIIVYLISAICGIIIAESRFCLKQNLILLRFKLMIFKECLPFIIFVILMAIMADCIYYLYKIKQYDEEKF